MKKHIFPFLFVITLLVFTGCSTKFNIAAPYKNITVIYGYLDMNDTAHYIRIQKAFMDQTKSAITMSQTPDSSFYTNLNVMIKRMDFSDTILIDTIHLTRVDLDQEGYPKQQGVFFNAPNYAYKFKNLLNPNYIYRIIVTNLQTGQVDSAEAPVIDDRSQDINPLTQTPYFVSNEFSDTGKIDFASTAQNRNYNIYCTYYPAGGFNFENSPSPVVVAQAFIRFNWEDSDYTTNQVTAHYFDFDAGFLTPSNISADGVQIDYAIADINLYDAVNSGLGAAPPHVIRLMDKCKLFVYVGTQDFLSYLNNSLTQGVGLTGSEIEPVYTNIKGTGALGLFTSRGVQTGTLNITDETMDSLENSALTAQNNIRGRVN